jgi:hypothetical protein
LTDPNELAQRVLELDKAATPGFATGYQSGAEFMEFAANNAVALASALLEAKEERASLRRINDAFRQGKTHVLLQHELAEAQKRISELEAFAKDVGYEDCMFLGDGCDCLSHRARRLLR